MGNVTSREMIRATFFIVWLSRVYMSLFRPSINLKNNHKQNLFNVIFIT